MELNLPLDAPGAKPYGLSIEELVSAKFGNIIGRDEVCGPLISLEMEDEHDLMGLLLELLCARRIYLLPSETSYSLCTWIGYCCIFETAFSVGSIEVLCGDGTVIIIS